MRSALISFASFKNRTDYQTLLVDFRKLGLEYIGCGRHRHVFYTPSKRNVIKVPANECGLMDNGSEAFYYAKSLKAPFYYPMARCRFVPNTALLLMEYVEPLSYKELPEWASAVDCGQAGRTRNGKFAAYDYA